MKEAYLYLIFLLVGFLMGFLPSWFSTRKTSTRNFKRKEQLEPKSLVINSGNPLQATRRKDLDKKVTIK